MEPSLSPSAIPLLPPRQGSRALQATMWLAAADLALVTVVTLTTTSRTELLGVAVPTLLTQGLLLLGVGLGSNVARRSYLAWTLLGIVMAWIAGDLYSDSSALARWGTTASNVMTAGILIGLCLPATLRHFTAAATTRRNEDRLSQLGRVRRNLAIGLGWLMVLPISAVAGHLAGTPLLAVLVSCAPALLVCAIVVYRQLRGGRRAS